MSGVFMSKNNRDDLQREWDLLQNKLEELNQKRQVIDLTAGNSADKKNAQRQIKALDSELKEITTKQEKIEAKMEKLQDQTPSMTEHDFSEIVKRYDLYYLETDEVYVSKKREDRMMVWRKGAFHFASLKFPYAGDLMNYTNQKSFLQYLHSCERCKESWGQDTESTEYDLSAYNLTHRNKVLDHVSAGSYHPIYDVLFKSISDGRQDIEDYWKKLIMRKFYDLKKSRDPAPCVTSKGSIGMTLFGQRFMPGLLGKSCVFSGSIETLTGAFTGHLQGKLWVNIEEAVVDRATHNKLKQIVHSPTLTIHPKGLTPFQVTNYVNYSLSTNEANGPVKLEGTKSDRRFLAYRVEGDLYKWALQVVGIDKMREEVSAKFPQFWGVDKKKVAKTWIEMNDHQFDDPEQMGAFLWDILEEFNDWLEVGALDTIITPEYHDFVDSNKTTLQMAGDIIFNHPSFKSIKKSDFYNFARKWGKNYGTGGLPAENKVKAEILRKWDVEEHTNSGVRYWKRKNTFFIKQNCNLYEDEFDSIPCEMPTFKDLSGGVTPIK